MSDKGQALLDDNNKPILAGIDPNTHKVVNVQVTTVGTDSLTGAPYGTLAAGGLSTNDGTFARESGGNLASITTNTGNTSTATGATSDAAYSSGSGSIVSILKGLYTKLGNVVIAAGTALIGGVNLVDAAGSNKASVDSSGNVYARGGYTELASLSAVSLNADLIASTDVSAYKSVALHLTGTWSGTLTFQGSNDNSVWYSIRLVDIASVGSATNTTYNSIFAGPLRFRYLRVRMTAYASGTVNGIAELYTWITSENGISATLGASTNVIGSTTIQTASGTALVADQSNTELRTSIYGKNSTAGDTAVGVDSNNSVYIRGNYTEQASLSAGALNANLVASTDVSAYKWMSMHITGTYSGTLTFYGSNNNSNWEWITLVPCNGPTTNASPTFSTSGTGLFERGIGFRYLKVTMTSYTSGTANGVLELYTEAPGHSMQMWVNQEGTWTTHLSANNDTVPANTAANKVIKSYNGYLASVVVTTLGTAALSFYDNGSTNSGTVLLTIPASAAVGTIYKLDGWAKNGIVAAGVTNCPGCTVYFD